MFQVEVLSNLCEGYDKRNEVVYEDDDFVWDLYTAPGRRMRREGISRACLSNKRELQIMTNYDKMRL